LEATAEKSAVRANHGRRQVLFEPGDLVWLPLRKERFPEQRKSKLSPRGDGPFKVLKRVGDNAYVLELPDDYGVSPIFNVGDLTPYAATDVDDSRTSPFQEGENDEESTPPLVPTFDGPITRSRSKELRQELETFMAHALLHDEEDKSKVKALTLMVNVTYV